MVEQALLKWQIVNDTAYFDGKIAQKGIADLKMLKNKNKPFFLALGFMKPHLPFNAPKKYWDLYDRSNIELPESYIQPKTTPKEAFHNFGELRNYGNIPKKGDLPDDLAKELIHGYYACVSYVDAQIGLVLDELKTVRPRRRYHCYSMGRPRLEFRRPQTLV